MLLTISTDSGAIFSLDLDPSETIENLKALLEVDVIVKQQFSRTNFLQTGIILSNQIILFEGKELQNNQKLSDVGVKENDLVVLTTKKSKSPGVVPPGIDPRAIQILEYIKNDPNTLHEILQVSLENMKYISRSLQNNPAMGEAILSGDAVAITNVLKQQDTAKKTAEAEKIRKMV
jgi:DNA damage-inducible protein 1